VDGTEGGEAREEAGRMSRPRRMLFHRDGVPVPYEYFVRDIESARVLADVLSRAGAAVWPAEEPDENNPFPPEGEAREDSSGA
jgi:hypothetical protein